MGIAVALANWYNQFKRLNKGDGYTMNLLCEEVHKLEAEFKQCRKLLNAIGDENRQHLICVMMNMPIDGGLVVEIVEHLRKPKRQRCLYNGLGL